MDMSIETGAMIGLGLASVAAKSYGCWGRSKLKKWNKVNLAGIVMSKSTGKTRLCQSLKGHSNLLLVDINDCVKQEVKQSHADYLIESKEYVDNLKSKLKEYKLVLLCSSIDEAKYYGIDEDNICVVTPSNKLFDSLLLSEKDPEKCEQMKTSRLELISMTDKDMLNVFNDYTSLYNTIRGAFKLKNKF